MQRSKESPLRVVFVHLDLGIGGAERLVVDAALALKRRGHKVSLLTSHHDPAHCFEETGKTGELGSCVEVLGAWLPRTIGGRFVAVCGLVRMLYLALWMVLRAWTSFGAPDLFFVDGVSLPVPLLKLTGSKVLFYCHFPDKLLCVERTSILKQVYRAVIDMSEEVSTGAADAILVNSEFTGAVFKTAFSSLRSYSSRVLYPCAPAGLESTAKELTYAQDDETVFVSLNRFERKKNLQLAVDALALLRGFQWDDEVATDDFLVVNKAGRRAVLLVVAGGYDDRVEENIEYLKELQHYATSRGIEWSLNSVVPLSAEGDAPNKKQGLSVRIEFRTSISQVDKQALLLRAAGLLYTPANEHFGIVPVEAMSLGCPVIAVASGGPLETIVDGVTGFLRSQEPAAFSSAMFALMNDSKLRSSMSSAGRERVKNKFSFEAFSESLECHAREAVALRTWRAAAFSLLFWSIPAAALACLLSALSLLPTRS